jgi:hypothetical protein
METITQRTELPEFLEAEAKLYLGELQPAIAGQKAADLSQVYGPQFVAGMDPLQQEAVKQATAGIGGYEPYIQAAQAATGPTGYQAYMSPYQQDVISSTLQEYDIQAQKGLPGISQAAYQAGAFGGARQGVAEAEYQAASDRNRAALQAQLLQQGFGQAQQAAQTQFGQQMQLAQQVPSLLGQQVAGLTTLGGGLQAQRQAELSAQQQLQQQQLIQPLTAAQTYGQGIMGLISGYPTTTTTTQPSPSPMQSALGLGATLAGVYRALR